jgi:hypothetical protein
MTRAIARVFHDGWSAKEAMEELQDALAHADPHGRE